MNFGISKIFIMEKHAANMWYRHEDVPPVWEGVLYRRRMQVDYYNSTRKPCIYVTKAGLEFTGTHT